MLGTRLPQALRIFMHAQEGKDHFQEIGDKEWPDATIDAFQTVIRVRTWSWRAAALWHCLLAPLPAFSSPWPGALAGLMIAVVLLLLLRCPSTLPELSGSSVPESQIPPHLASSVASQPSHSQCTAYT
jgi:hypothetical protein